MAVEIGHPGQDSQDRKSGQIDLTGQHKHMSLESGRERTGLPVHESGVRRAVDKVAGQNSWNRTDGRRLPGLDRTSGTGHLRPDKWRGQPRQVRLDKSA